MSHLLTILILVPVAGALASVLYGVVAKGNEGHYKWIALVTSLITFLLSLLLLQGAGTYPTPEFRFEENISWISAIQAQYHLGVDGISLWLVILTTLLMPIAIVSSWTAIKKRLLAYYLFLLILESAMIGVFVSLDLLIFYLFFEASLVPMFFLIGIWGGERRIYSAVKFFIYTAVGSLLMLVAIIALYYRYHSFDYTTLVATMADDSALAGPLGFWLFLAFALAFSIKVPLFPLHTWLPDAHTEAPTAGSVILAGVLLKMGTYGLMRFNIGMFPEMAKEFAPWIIILAIIGIIYGALVAMVQPDVKRLVAYSSVSHMGFVVLGLFSFTELGMQGALYQMLNHGVSTGALFLFVGFIYERRHTRLINDFGGLATPMPWFSTLFVIASLSSIGLPFLNGFVGEFLILAGTWTSTAVSHPWIATMLAGTGVIWAAVYMLWMLQRVVFGPVTNDENAKLLDLNTREVALMLPLILLMLVMGVYPRVFLDRSQASVEAVRKQVAIPPAGGSIEAAAAPKQDH
ncbi:MAG TPA: NADH-quinone oxidoreductase subunit M [Pyrinomonadaceae bacterium]|nr:NADH-quinone oxidoreductase subunit M [Pyrinomonadaceae bacterium]